MDVARPISYMFAMFISAFAIILIFSSKFDQNVQAYVSEAVDEFVNDACTSGYMAPEKYMKMMQKISGTGNLYNVNLIYQSKTAMPLIKGNKVVKGSYVDSYQLYTTDEILEEMFPSGSVYYENFPMKTGDNLKVQLTLKKPTMAGRLLMFVTKTETRTISYTYSSYVGNTEENGMLKYGDVPGGLPDREPEVVK